MYDASNQIKIGEVFFKSANKDAVPVDGPELWLFTEQAIKRDGTRLHYANKGFGVTVPTLEQAILAYKREYKKDPPDLNGALDAENLSSFQIAYDAVRSEGKFVDAPEIATKPSRELRLERSGLTKRSSMSIVASTCLQRRTRTYPSRAQPTDSLSSWSMYQRSSK